MAGRSHMASVRAGSSLAVKKHPRMIELFTRHLHRTSGASNTTRTKNALGIKYQYLSASAQQSRCTFSTALSPFFIDLCR